MGNSPSKNELSTSSSQTASAQGSAPSGDLDPDDKGPALSNLSNIIHRIDSDATLQHTPNDAHDYHGESTRSPAINIKSANTHYKSLRKSSSPRRERRVDLDLEIGMAKLLNSNPMMPDELPRTSLVSKLMEDPSLKGALLPEYPSLLDSERSMGSTVSPVFTTLDKDKDDSLVLSLNSTSPSLLKPYLMKPSSLKASPNSSTSQKLDSIAEGSFECSGSPSMPKLSKKNLRKHQSSMPPLEKSYSSSSNLSSSPPLVHANKKLDIDVDDVIDRLIEVGMKKSTRSRLPRDSLPVSVSEVKYILHKARSIFLDQPTLLRLSPPVKIVGDIHGQFSDLIRIFNSCGYPPYSNYLFLGDYVDRGHKSLETMLLLLCYKIKYPENFFMLRGNHESANITKIYGFYDECKRRLPSNRLWKNFVDVFNTLPIAATINDKIFCIHGGLLPDLHDLEQIEDIKRPTDIPDKGLLADLLWSDPDRLVKNFSMTNWPKNDRGVSYCFGRKHVDYFCQTFKMDLIVRGHMVVEDGYEFFNRRRLVTVFLAPNYCGEFNNFGAVMSVDKSLYCLFELIKPQ